MHPTSTHSAYFWWTRLPQKQEIPEKWNDDIIIAFFQVFLAFGVAGSIKSMPNGYSLDAEFNFAHGALLIEIWVKTQGDMSKIRTKKVVFFFSSSKINKYYFIILTIILLFSLGGPFWVENSSNESTHSLRQGSSSSSLLSGA